MAAPKIFSRLRLDWPLLGKELLEQAARKQMYVVRVVYAVLLFGAFCFYYARHLSQGTVAALGGGTGPFRFLVVAQLVTIFLFLPPIMAGALAQEKERDTLGLLFLTDLTPWELILQKYFGRLIPMLTLLFLSLPLLAIAYSLGGVSADMLYYTALTLFLTCLWVGALALECSAHEASTFQALIRCWGFCLLIVAGCSIFGPFSVLLLPLGPISTGLVFIVPSIINGVVYLVITLLLLARTKQILETRAFVQRRNPFGQQFRHLDQFWKDLRKLLRAMMRKRDVEAYALAQQVVRRELGGRADSHSWSLGGFLLTRMQVPNVLAFGIIFGFIVLIILMTNVALDPKSGGGFSFVIGCLWILMLLTVPIQSANAVASERMNERMGPMLTTPLTARQILDEWLGPVRRWIHLLSRPLMVVFVVEAFVRFYTQDSRDFRHIALYLGVSLLTVLVYPGLAQWSCLWIGLRIKNQIRAMMTSVLVVVMWCIVPPAASSYLTGAGLLPLNWNESLRFVSPITIIDTAEAIGRANNAPSSDMVVMALIHLVTAAILMWTIRRICLANADRYLGRI